MLYPILFIIISLALVILVSATKDLRFFTAVNAAVIGLFIYNVLGFPTFALLAGCFALIHAIRIVIKYMDRQTYDLCFTDDRKNVKYLYGKLGISIALLFIVAINKSNEEGLIYNLPHFKIAFFASIAIVFAIEVSYAAGALLGGTFNPITQKKVAPNAQGGISTFGAVCTALSIIVICVGYFNFGNPIKNVIVVGACGALGYLVYLLIGALLTKKDSSFEDYEAAKVNSAFIDAAIEKAEDTTEAEEAQSANEEISHLTLDGDKTAEMPQSDTNTATFESLSESAEINPEAKLEAPNQDDTQEMKTKAKQKTSIVETVKEKFFDIYQTAFVSEFLCTAIALVLGLILRS